MGRPSKNNAEYFPHFGSMRNHRKVKVLRNKFGTVLGYAFWCLMLEWLTEQDGLEWEFSEIECEMFAAELGVSSEEIPPIINFCIQIELLFKTGDGFIYSESLNENLNAVFEKRKRARDKSKTRKRRENLVSVTETPQTQSFCHRNATSNGVSVTEMPQSKVKESKEENSKGNQSKVIPSDASASGDFKEEVLKVEKKDPTPGPRKTKAEPTTLHHLAVKMFCDFYEEKFLTGYEFSGAKDGAAFKQLLPKISNKIAEAGKEQTDENILKGLGFFLRSIQDDWVIKNLTPAIINLKFNELFTTAKNGNSTNKTKQPNSPERASALAREFRRGKSSDQIGA